jgi:predicted ATPase/signal transduction histidine kinase
MADAPAAGSLGVPAAVSAPLGGDDAYAITETIHASNRATIYRAIRRADGRPVILKVLTPQYGVVHAERLRNELEIGAALALPSVVRALGRETLHGRPALILEDSGGHALARELGQPLPLGRFLRLALAIAASVEEVHQCDIVHRDLKPDNILVHPGGDEVKLTDFGIATTLPGQRPGPGSTRLIEGSLPYMSPEQTGRTNRALDQRSDLYSLGVTFYEMLTGRLPFQAADPVEWVHCHVALRPSAPTAVVPGLPPILSAMVMKLLAKDAEDRYQSARGLRHDLQRCLERLSDDGSIKPFALAEHDVSDRFQIPQRLYGRERESAALLQAWRRVVDSGAPELALVSGYAGIGKSALARELQRPVVQARGLFAAGKFDQYERDIPYATIAQALSELVLELLTQSEERIAGWRGQLLAALGANAQLIVGVIPPLELIIGAQPEAPALPPLESQNRFRLVFRQLIGVFAQQEHPLALFLDDLQWADAASLALLSELLTQREVRHLFVMGAFRDNEVNPAHPLPLALEAVQKTGAAITRLVLAPLSHDRLRAFIGDVLHAPADAVAPLAALVEEKTAGNPFFTIQFLTALHDERLLEVDAASGAWHWDLAKIRAKGFTDNVVDLMLGKLRRLSPAARGALELYACLGPSAEVATLRAVLDLPDEEATHAALSEPVRAGLLVRFGEVYGFLHDRVQEAAYSSIPPGARAELHLRIGRRLLSELPEAALEDRLFDVVNQLDRGVALIDDAHERETLRRLAIAAGEKAKTAIAYTAALRYFEQADALSPADAWSARYEETFELTLARAECEYLLGHFDAADGLFGPLLANARSKPDRARVCSLRIRLHQIAGRYDLGLALAHETFRLFDLTSPADETEARAAFEAEVKAIAVNLAGRRIAELVDAPMATDPEARAAIALLVDYLPCAFNGGSRTLPLYVFKVLNLCLRNGNTPEACFTYSAAAMMMVSVLGDTVTAYELSAMSLALNARLGDAKLRGTVQFLHGACVNFWRRPFATGPAIMEPAFAALMEVGDFLYVGYLGAHVVWQAVEQGDTLDEVWAISRRWDGIYRQTHNEFSCELLREYDQLIACLKGRTSAPGSFDDDGFNEGAQLELFTRTGATSGLFVHHMLKELANLVFERTADALAAATAAEALVAANLGTALEGTHHFIHALAAAAAHDEAEPERQRELAGLLRAKLGKLARWAESCPENFGNRHALVAAELARLEGRDLEAMRLYERAIREAADNGFVHIEALANELGARFFRARGLDRIADERLRAARAGYQRWGADGKVRQLDQRHPHLREPRALATTLTFTGVTDQIGLMSVIKASQAISGEIDLDGLLTKLVQVVIAQAGAEHGVLLLNDSTREPPHALVIAARASLDGGAVAVELPRVPLAAAAASLPASIVSYVARTRSKVLLEDAAAEPRFASDPYIERSRPRSVLCLPILRQAELVGLLYLENNLIAGAFRPDQLEVLDLLASQAAISLDHALLLSRERTAREQALEALRLREEFLTVASHELRTPMASLTLTMQVMQGRASPDAKPPPPAEVRRLLDLAARQTERMNRLIDELFDVTRIHAGQLPLVRAQVELEALVRGVIERFAPDLEHARCPVTLAVDGPVQGEWDRTRIERVVENLLSNALKFGDGKPIAIGLGLREGRARLTIEDAGIGIPAEEQAHVFERFGRAVSAEHYGGLGLGLYICKQIVSAHGGTIAVESAPGTGARFTVELPCTASR